MQFNAFFNQYIEPLSRLIIIIILETELKLQLLMINYNNQYYLKSTK